MATGSDQQVDAAADVINRHGAVGIEETSGPEPRLPAVVREGLSPSGTSPVLACRIREPEGGATFFVW